MLKEDFNIALFGAGSIAHSHAKAFQALQGVNVCAVAEIKEQRLKKFARKYNIETAVLDYHQLLSRDDIDAVIICLPNHLHAPASIEAMQAGKHVLVEKPMALNARAAADMVAVQKNTGRTLMVTLQSRYSSMIQETKKFITKNFGEIYYGKCGYLRRSGIPGWGSWFTRKEEAGGGPCADIGVHVLDKCLLLMGYPEPVSVTASTYSKFGPEGKGKGGWGTPEPDGYFDVEDLAAAFIRFNNNASVVLEASWAANRPDKQWLEVLGTKGGAVFDGKMKIYTPDKEKPLKLSGEELDINDGRENMTLHFIECCQTGKKPETAPEYGLILNKIFDAVYESGLNNGRQILLN